MNQPTQEELSAWLEKAFTKYFEKAFFQGSPTPTPADQPHCGCYGILHRSDCKHWGIN